MRWIRISALVVGVIALSVVRCGGGDDGGGGTTTPAATSAKTLNAVSNATNWMFEVASLIPSTVPQDTGSSVKATTSSNISCTGTQAGFECVIWDSLGSQTSADHKCDVTGTWNSTTSMFTDLDLAYDCYTFNPDSNTTVDGDWSAAMTIDYNNMPNTSAMAVGRGFNKAENSGECDVDDITDACGSSYSGGGTSCTVDCDGGAQCDASVAVMDMQWTVGARGITMVDECGTYVIDAGTTSTNTMCMPTTSQFIMTFGLSGTINGDVVNQTINISCDYSSAM